MWAAVAMSVRNEVANFASLGRLPREDAGEGVFQRHEALLRAISRPVTAEEAEILMKCFPDSEESAYGAAWSLLHLIETAKPLSLPSSRPSEPWLGRLWDRSHRL
jgi:hypothetical protein